MFGAAAGDQRLHTESPDQSTVFVVVVAAVTEHDIWAALWPPALATHRRHGAALPVFRAQSAGHFITTASTAAFRIVPTMAVYAGTKFAVRAICEGLRQEAGDSLRVATVSPGPIATDFAEASTNSQVRAEITRMRDHIAIPPDAIARAIAFAIEQPAAVDVSEIVVRPTAQS